MFRVGAIVLVFLVPSIAAAQPRTSGVFVQVGPLADFSATTDVTGIPVSVALSFISPPDAGDSNEQVERSRTRVRPGASVAAGVFITPSVSLRVEGSFQGEHTRTTRTSTIIGSRLSDQQDLRQTTKVTDVIVAAAWHHGSSRKTSVNYLAGMVFRRERDDVASSVTYDTTSSSIVNGRIVQNVSSVTIDNSYSLTAYGSGIMAGVDVVWQISKAVAIVPQFRMVAATNALAMRPAVTLRWQP